MARQTKEPTPSKLVLSWSERPSKYHELIHCVVATKHHERVLERSFGEGAVKGAEVPAPNPRVFGSGGADEDRVETAIGCELELQCLDDQLRRS